MELFRLIQEVLDDLLTYCATLLGVELTGVEIVLMHSGGVRLYVVSHWCRPVANRYIVGVYKVDIRLRGDG